MVYTPSGISDKGFVCLRWTVFFSLSSLSRNLVFHMPWIDHKIHWMVALSVLFYFWDHAFDGLSTVERTKTDWNSHLVPVPFPVPDRYIVSFVSYINIIVNHNPKPLRNSTVALTGTYVVRQRRAIPLYVSKPMPAS